MNPVYLLWTEQINNEKKLPIGIYIVHFEAINSKTGETKNYKAATVIAAKL